MLDFDQATGPGGPSEVQSRGSAAERSNAARQQILTSTAKLLQRLPLAKITMEDIARDVGIARQTIYKHFANQEEILVALFIAEITHNHQPHLLALHEEAINRSQLAKMFLEQLRLASEWVLLDPTFNPTAAPRIAELVLSSEALAECNSGLWRPILEDYATAGTLRGDVDIAQAIRWMTYQAVWFLSHPNALTKDPAEREVFVESFMMSALVNPSTS